MNRNLLGNFTWYASWSVLVLHRALLSPHPVFRFTGWSMHFRRTAYSHLARVQLALAIRLHL